MLPSDGDPASISDLEIHKNLCKRIESYASLFLVRAPRRKAYQLILVEIHAAEVISLLACFSDWLTAEAYVKGAKRVLREKVEKVESSRKCGVNSLRSRDYMEAQHEAESDEHCEVCKMQEKVELKQHQGGDQYKSARRVMARGWDAEDNTWCAVAVPLVFSIFDTRGSDTLMEMTSGRQKRRLYSAAERRVTTDKQKDQLRPTVPNHANIPFNPSDGPGKRTKGLSAFRNWSEKRRTKN